MDDPRSGRREISPEAAERLRTLHARIRQHEREREDLVRAVLQVKKREGVSVREIARAVGVGKSTVQDWLDHARDLG